MKSRTDMIFLLVMGLFPLSGFAHAPNKIIVHYDLEKKEVKVTMVHPTPDVVKHTVDKLLIYLNDKEIIVQHYSKQKLAKQQEAHFIIPSLKKNDTLTLIASCNKYGKKKATITVE